MHTLEVNNFVSQVIPKLVNQACEESHISLIYPTEWIMFKANMTKAYLYLTNHLGSLVSYEYIAALNKCVIGTVNDKGGRIRTDIAYIAGTEIVIDPITIEEFRSQLNDLYKIKDHKLRAVIIYCYIRQAQPFSDGNTRVAMLVCQHILLGSLTGFVDLSNVPVADFDKASKLLYENKPETMMNILFNNIVYADI